MLSREFLRTKGLWVIEASNELIEQMKSNVKTYMEIDELDEVYTTRKMFNFKHFDKIHDIRRVQPIPAKVLILYRYIPSNSINILYTLPFIEKNDQRDFLGTNENLGNADVERDSENFKPRFSNSALQANFDIIEYDISKNQSLKIEDKYNDPNEEKYPLIFSRFAKSTLKNILRKLRENQSILIETQYIIASGALNTLDVKDIIHFNATYYNRGAKVNSKTIPTTLAQAISRESLPERSKSFFYHLVMEFEGINDLKQNYYIDRKYLELLKYLRSDIDYFPETKKKLVKYIKQILKEAKS